MLENTIFPQFMADNIVIRLLIASLLGAVIGFERDVHGRAAGLRTNLLISLGAAVFMILSESIALSYAGKIGDPVFRTDPARIAAQIVTGIGFLGAGVIVKYGFSIRGLTTAACIWISAGIGMSAGAGFLELAIITTVISLFCLVSLHPLERKYAKDSFRVLEVETSSKVDVSELIKVVQREDLSILYLDKRINYVDNKMLLKFTLRLHYKGVTDKASHLIIRDIEDSTIPVHRISWLHQ